MLFSHPEFDPHEAVIHLSDDARGLRAIIALHNTRRGPGLGGTRLWAYESEEAALTDVLRLSRGMSYKSALADLPFGGAKAVILANPDANRRQLFEAYGEAIERLGGQFITAEDVGTSPQDMDVVRTRTRHVSGLSSSGDPSPITAAGVFGGMQAALAHRFGTPDIAGRRVLVQGLGHVGYALCALLHAAGAQLLASDIDPKRLTQAEAMFGAIAVAAEDCLATPADVFAPCALGGILTAENVDRLAASIVAGSANNPLASAAVGQQLAERGVLYCPDYVINAGGLIHVAGCVLDLPPEAIAARLDGIASRLTDIFEQAAASGEPTSVIADRMAQARLSVTGAVEA